LINNECAEQYMIDSDIDAPKAFTMYVLEHLFLDMENLAASNQGAGAGSMPGKAGY